MKSCSELTEPVQKFGYWSSAFLLEAMGPCQCHQIAFAELHPLADKEQGSELSCRGHTEGFAFRAGESSCTESPAEAESFPYHFEFL